MTIDEAIKILAELEAAQRAENTQDDSQAFKLGIEALHRCQEIKKYTQKDTFCLLPGETKDKEIADNMRDYWKHQADHAEH